jgi:hypothetical protein
LNARARLCNATSWQSGISNPHRAGRASASLKIGKWRLTRGRDAEPRLLFLIQLVFLFSSREGQLTDLSAFARILRAFFKYFLPAISEPGHLARSFFV